MSQWAPIFDSIVDSSLWLNCPPAVRVAWISILAKKDYRTHIVRVNPSRLSGWARISLEEAEEALRIFTSPDPHSSNDAHEGRRMIRVENGESNEYLVVTGAHYAGLMRSISKRNADAARQRELRASARKPSDDTEPPIDQGIPAETRKYEQARPILHYLNEMTGKRFRETETNLGFIAARLAEDGVVVGDVKRMIARQCAMWKTDPKMGEYLRPETLFNKTKFDGYLAAVDMPVDGNGSPPAKPASDEEIMRQVMG